MDEATAERMRGDFVQQGVGLLRGPADGAGTSVLATATRGCAAKNYAVAAPAGVGDWVQHVAVYAGTRVVHVIQA